MADSHPRVIHPRLNQTYQSARGDLEERTQCAVFIIWKRLFRPDVLLFRRSCPSPHSPANILLSNSHYCCDIPRLFRISNSAPRNLWGWQRDRSYSPPRRSRLFSSSSASPLPLVRCPRIPYSIHHKIILESSVININNIK